MNRVGWIKCARCGAEVLGAEFDDHYAWCKNHPLPKERERNHGAQFKATIIVEGKRFNFRCMCGVDGRVWYSTKQAVWEAIVTHRQYSSLG